MTEGEDPQRIKRIGVDSYDYERDPRWADYWSNILIPPHMVSRPDVVTHFKRKFYQRFIDPDLVVEPISSGNSSQSARASGSSSSPPRTEQPRPRASASNNTTSTPPPTVNASSLRWQTIQFSVNAWIPRAWNLQAVQVWFQSVIATKDFIYFLYSLMFVSSQTCLKCMRYLEEPCAWVESNTTTLSILSSNAEIALGFLLILSLFSWQRNILQTFMYWQLLKLMYHAPVTASYHQSVWAKIGQTLNPYIHRYPFMNTPISAVQRWWFR
ncbi:hypothetical protein QJS10_CPB12g00226 [Acorus calamus]|uniref:Uncharacterized protein n=1 Tax=Acorus calamus TaxID=4465 RepID=A0AAV9DMP8_ACOCL|nr:hypothetical protein QJS10_CPB12g00226 [Acorus calamus]